MQLAIAEATELAIQVLCRHGMRSSSARLVADHLVDAALCGHAFSSLPRVLAIVEAMRDRTPVSEIRVVRENQTSALIDGGDNVGYVVAVTATDKAIEICKRSGVAVVVARNTWFSGRLAFYVERAARAGLVALHTTNTTARVAPYGGIDRLMGTNPFSVAFPSADHDPLIIDIGTSATSWGDVVLSQTKGEPLPVGVAVDAEGRPTVDPAAALAGAFLPWGGPRGSALSLAVQLLGMLAGSAVVIDDVSDYGLFFLLIDPETLVPNGGFRSKVSELRRTLQNTRPAPGASQVRVPGDASLQKRKRGLEQGTISVDDVVYRRLIELSK